MIYIEKETNHMAEKGATLFAMDAEKNAKEYGRFLVALSGGGTPRPLFRKLKAEPFRSAIPWSKIHIFWVDERCVPSTHEASNYGAALKDFIGAVPVPESQVHPMPGHMDSNKGAALYEKALQNTLLTREDKLPVLDFVLLGIGKDGHTASLFPGQKALRESKRWVLSVKGGHPNVERLTLTLPVINHARKILFMAAGKEKALIVKKVAELREKQYPASWVRPPIGKTIWLIDQDAASLLSKGSDHAIQS
jgi:6-phosphogluconolactonase